MKTYTGNSYKSYLAHSEEPDEMLHYAAFHQGQHCLLWQEEFSEKEIQLNFGNYNLW